MTDDRSISSPLSLSNLRLARGTSGVLSWFPELEEMLDRPAGLLSG